MPVDVLAVGAHADDIELTCAGTLVMLAQRGRRFGILDLTRSELGTRGSVATREAEAKRAAEILGAAFRETLGLSDGGLETGREAELAVIEVIRREKPRLVLAPYPEDRHPDHARAGRLVTDAAFYAGPAEAYDGSASPPPAAGPLLLDFSPAGADAARGCHAGDEDPPRGRAGLRQPVPRSRLEGGADHALPAVVSGKGRGAVAALRVSRRRRVCRGIYVETATEGRRSHPGV